MPATPIPSSFLILQPRFNFYFKPIFNSLTYKFSPSSFTFNHISKFSIPKHSFTSSTKLQSTLSQAAATESPSDNGGGGARSGALTPGPVTGDVQKIDVNPPKGTRDFPPEDMRLRNWLFDNFKEVNGLYGYSLHASNNCMDNCCFDFCF